MDTQIIIVRNKRLKISPEGMITLPLSARRCLQMEVGQGSRVDVSLTEAAVMISKPEHMIGKWRVSRRGMMELRAESRKLLSSGIERHYWMELDDAQRKVFLYPWLE